MRKPFNLYKWIEENRDLLKPPVGNKNLYPEGTDYIVMIVGGPNARKDYHYNETEELFFQIEGDITVKIQEDGKVKDVVIKEGELFLLPPGIPHSPIRGEGTVGLVIERVRKEKHTDGLEWYCDKCNEQLHKYRFPLKDIEQDFQPRFKDYYANENYRTCNNCGNVMEVDERFVQ